MWAEERLNRTVSTRLVQLTCLERQKLSVGVERFARSLRACVSTKGEMACGSTAKQRQRSDFMSGETLEDPSPEINGRALIPTC